MVEMVSTIYSAEGKELHWAELMVTGKGQGKGLNLAIHLVVMKAYQTQKG